jgi:hypothetical protein
MERFYTNLFEGPPSVKPPALPENIYSLPAFFGLASSSGNGHGWTGVMYAMTRLRSRSSIVSPALS